MRRLLPLLAVAALALAGCLEPNPPPADDGAGDPGGGDGNAEPVAFRSLARGQQSGLPETRTVVTDPAVWQALWANHTSREMTPPPAPEVDFGAERALVVVLAQKGSGCWWVEVTHVNATSDGLVATVLTHGEPPGMVCPGVVTQPFHFVAIPRGGPVHFEERFTTEPPADAGSEPGAGDAPQEPADMSDANPDAQNATSMRTLDSGSHSGHRGGVQRVIEWEHGWNEFWDAHASDRTPAPERPEVDFERERVAVVVLEDKPNGCWAVRLRDYAAGPDAATLQVVAYAPPPDVMCTSVVTQPYHIVAIPKGPPVTFEAREEVGPPAEE